jgi:hypothetical protein
VLPYQFVRSFFSAGLSVRLAKANGLREFLQQHLQEFKDMQHFSLDMITR